MIENLDNNILVKTLQKRTIKPGRVANTQDILGEYISFPVPPNPL